jgi:LacI family transcriptional regulator
LLCIGKLGIIVTLVLMFLTSLNTHIGVPALDQESTRQPSVPKVPAQTFLTSVGAGTPTEQIARIKDHLRGQILRGELLEGTRLIEEDIKRSIDATHRVIRAALLELTQEGLLTRRRHAGTIVAHKANIGSAPPVITRIGILTSLAEDVFETGRFVPPVMAGVREALHPQGQFTLFANSTGSHAPIDRLPMLLPESIRGSIQGLVAIEANNGSTLNDLARAGIPVVAVDYWPSQALFDAVVTDYQDAGYAATAHLLSLGHRRVGFIGEGPNYRSNDPTWQERLGGYLRAMSEVNAANGNFWILNTRRRIETVQESLPDFQKEHRLTAYVLCTGGLLPPVLAAFQQIGLSCPSDVSVASADDTKRSFSTGSLSSVRIDYSELGRRAIRLLVARLMYRAVPPVRSAVAVEFHAGDSSTHYKRNV